MKNLIIISAPSGAGKTTLCRSIQAQVSQVKWSVSFTTRKKRKMEKNGVDYQFISESTFKKLFPVFSSSCFLKPLRVVVSLNLEAQIPELVKANQSCSSRISISPIW